MFRTQTCRLVVSLVLVLGCAGVAGADDDWTRGLEFFRAQKYGDAAKEFEAVIQRAPEYAGAYYMLGLTQRAQGKSSAALGNLGKAVELDGAQVLYRIELGNTLVSAGQYSDAFSTLKGIDFSSLAQNYRTPYALAFAKAASEVNQASVAIPVLARQARAEGSNVRLYQALGASYSVEGQHREAFDAYLKAYELDSSNPALGESAVKAGIATARRTTGDSAKRSAYTRAAEVAERLASAAPTFEHLLLAGEAWLGAKQYRKALEWFDKAKAKQSQNVLVHYYAAQCHTSLGNLDSALSALQQALKIGAGGKVRQQIYNQLGYVYDKQKAYDKAASAYQEAGNSAKIAEMREKAELAAQNQQAEAEQAEFRRKLQALELQIEELEKLGEIEQANELRKQLDELKKALRN